MWWNNLAQADDVIESSGELVENLGGLPPTTYLFAFLALGIVFIALLISMYYRSQMALQKAHENGMKMYQKMTDGAEEREKEAKEEIRILKSQVEELISSRDEAWRANATAQGQILEEKDKYSELNKQYESLKADYADILKLNEELRAELTGIKKRLETLETKQVNEEETPDE